MYYLRNLLIKESVEFFCIYYKKLINRLIDKWNVGNKCCYRIFKFFLVLFGVLECRKDGLMSFCLDYYCLNKVIIKDV